jgi:hypothetical protein
LNVNYRETPRKSNRQTIVWNSTINERHATISITLSIEPKVSEDKKISSFSQIQIIRGDEQNFEHMRKDHVGMEYRFDCFFSSILFYYRRDQSWCSACFINRLTLL